MCNLQGACAAYKPHTPRVHPVSLQGPLILEQASAELRPPPESHSCPPSVPLPGEGSWSLWFVTSDVTCQWEGSLKDLLFLGGALLLYFSSKALFSVVSWLLSLYIDSRITKDCEGRVDLPCQGMKSFHISFNCHGHPVRM